VFKAKCQNIFKTFLQEKKIVQFYEVGLKKKMMREPYICEQTSSFNLLSLLLVKRGAPTSIS
jgi:hypothetical protein